MENILKMEKHKFILIIIGMLCLTAFLSIVSLSNASYDIIIDMDDETRDYLVAHDFCIKTYNPPYDSNESTTLFIGDCKYLNTTN